MNAQEAVVVGSPNLDTPKILEELYDLRQRAKLRRREIIRRRDVSIYEDETLKQIDSQIAERLTLIDEAIVIAARRLIVMGLQKPINVRDVQREVCGCEYHAISKQAQLNLEQINSRHVRFLLEKNGFVSIDDNRRYMSGSRTRFVYRGDQ